MKNFIYLNFDKYFDDTEFSEFLLENASHGKKIEFWTKKSKTDNSL